jgi:cell division protein FtsZ
VANEKTTVPDAFAMAYQVLYSGVACITDLVVKEGLINLDFADVRAVMREMGKAMMGTGEASGDKRALRSAEVAICNPLIDNVSLQGARGVLISITKGIAITKFSARTLLCAAARLFARQIPRGVRTRPFARSAPAVASFVINFAI